MHAIEPTTRKVLNELKLGERVEILHQVKVGSKTWKTTVAGTVEGVERRRHGLHFRRNFDDKVFSDQLTLKLPDGSLSTVAIDEFSEITKL